MIITLHQLNRAGFSEDIILQYQSTKKVKMMLNSYLPPIKVYPPNNGKYSIADGIHRICAYLYQGILSFEATY